MVSVIPQCPVLCSTLCCHGVIKCLSQCQNCFILNVGLGSLWCLWNNLLICVEINVHSGTQCGTCTEYKFSLEFPLCVCDILGLIFQQLELVGCVCGILYWGTCVSGMMLRCCQCCVYAISPEFLSQICFCCLLERSRLTCTGSTEIVGRWVYKAMNAIVLQCFTDWQWARDGISWTLHWTQRDWVRPWLHTAGCVKRTSTPCLDP